MLSYHQFDEPPQYEGVSNSLFQLYRLRTAQCLTIGDIAKCAPYTIETLRFNATAELNRQDDNRRGLWIMTGVIVRAAINMGYHREPDPSSSLSVLQAEYRRRVWLSVTSMDDLASFQAGFPRMMPAIYSDTMEPRNLHDWQLSDSTTVLPPSRPLTEPTPAIYLIVKGRLLCALGRITDFHNALKPGPYEAALDIDKSLHEVYQNFPPHMKAIDCGEDLGSSPNKFRRSSLQLESLYHQGMCILHRKFIAKGRLEPRYSISRDRCISSALALLSHQRFLEPSWYKISQTRQMLSLAAMILFLELEHRRTGPKSDLSFDSDLLLQALKRSCAFWEVAKSSCVETERVYRILIGLLSSFQDFSETGSSGSSQARILEEPLPDRPGLRASFQPTAGGFTWDKDLFSMSDDMDLDWVGLSYLIHIDRVLTRA